MLKLVFANLLLMIKFILVILFLLPTTVSMAAERREFYVGARGLAMGGAQIATVNDETSIIVNPAALGRLRDNFLTVADPEISVGAKTQSVIGADVMAAFDPQTTLDKLNDGNHGKHMHQDAKIFPSFVVPNFGIGFLGHYSTDAEVDATGTTYRLDYTNDWAMVLGYNFRLWDGRIKFGFNARFVNRVQVASDLDPASVGLKLANISKEGVGIGSDVGMLITMPWDWLPTMALVYRDAGNTSYDVQDGLFYDRPERPDTTPASLDVGFSVFPITGKKSRMAIAVEVRDALNYGTVDDYNKLVHAGLEFNFYDAFFLRGGWNQRYYTAGMEFAIANYQLQLTTYGEEIGDATTNREDRRYLLKFAYRF